MNKEKCSLAELFFTFMKIGAFTFGGGYAMIPLIQRETSEKRGWIEKDEILEMVAVSESTPGPIAVNMATFVGYRLRGVAGALAATLGEVIPSFAIIAALSLVMQRFGELKAVKYAFMGIRAGVLALIVKALVSMFRACPKSVGSYVIMCAVFAAAVLTKVNVLVIIAAGAAAGLACSLVTAGRGKHDIT